MTNVAFIGLGVMGYPMAGHLAQAGHQVSVYNRTHSRALKWQSEYKGEVAASPREAASAAQAVFICVGNDDDLRSVTLGENGALAEMQKNSILVDHTTTSAKVARELSQIATGRGVGFLDAPVSGGQLGAEQGQLTIMTGGKQSHFQQAMPILQCYAKACRLMGPAGSGQLTKMVNQICVAGVIQGLAEGVHFAQQAGLDVDAVFQAISKGAAQSWQMDNRVSTMHRDEFEFGFAVDWMRKDLAFALEEARQNNASLPLTALVDQFYAEVQTSGGGRWDTSSLLRRLTQTSGHS